MNSINFTMNNVTTSAEVEKHLTIAQLKAVSIISLLTSATSCLGSFSVLLCSVYYKRVFYPEVFPTFHLAVADVAASLSLLISSVIFMSDTPGFPGADGPCDYMMTLVTSSYTVAFLLTLAYAMEALFRFRRRLSDAIHMDTSQNRVMSSRYMLLVYISAWVFPLGMATVLMIYIHNLRDNNSTGGFTRIYPQQCSSCFANFRFNEDYCWEEIEDGASWHYVIRLMFLLPLMVVMAANLALYVLINQAFKQVAMRRGLLSYHQRQEESVLNRKAALYQTVFFICWFPSIILGIASFAGRYDMASYYWLVVLQALLGPLQGICNSFLYGWRRDSFRRALSERSSLLNTNRATAMSVTL